MRGRISTDSAALKPLCFKASLNKYMLIAVVIKTFPKIFTKLAKRLFYFFIIVKRGILNSKNLFILMFSLGYTSNMSYIVLTMEKSYVN